ncbi:MAG TPA: hypothetical protein ENO11_00675 [Desulfobacteraceae bacterium]|nr:hypothetical protein [Desulfobacteraceae bacterium]
MTNRIGFVISVLVLLMTAPLMSGCGPVVGAGAAGAAYEYQNKRQMEMLEEDFKAGNIDKEEYLSRKEQIKKGSIIY